MPNAFQGINTMSSALRAFQTQLDVTGNNISNAETVGYTRRSVALRQAASSAVSVGKTVVIGNGVDVAAVSRVRDMFLTGRRAETESKLGRGQESLIGLNNIQEAMAEPGSDGISAAYDAFNNAWSALSASPGSAAAKSDVQLAGSRLATKVSTLARSLQSQKADNMASTKEILAKIDAAAAKVADLNTKIGEATAHGGTPNDLMDERDKAVEELSALADVTVSRNAAGYDVSLNGFLLVNRSHPKTVSDKYDASTGRIVEGSSSFAVNGGSLAGAHDVDAAIDATMARLDTFADTVRTEVNALFATGKTSGGTTGAPFFAEPVPPATTLGALGLRLDDPIAADANNIASGTSGLSGDGTLAAQISGLRDKKLSGLGNQTLGGYYATLVSDVGRQVASAQDSVDTYETVAKQIDAQISETSGVSMDDEMATLLRFQRAYQAAAKALSTFDSMTETLIGMLNR
jgi:flagellar hook-associated protein 1